MQTALPYPLTVQPSQGPNGVQWVLCDVNANSCGGPGANPPSAYPQILLPAHTGPYQLTVTIKNPTMGISFAPVADQPTNADAALWVVVGQGQHPGHQGMNSNGQINNAQLTNPTTLGFTDLNHNSGMMWLSYRMNFVGANNQAVNPIDPDIRNGGTNISTGFTQATAILIGVAVIGLLVLAFFGFRMMNRNRSAGL